jgi:hypothetical protein
MSAPTREQGREVADKCDEWIDYHNQFVIDVEGRQDVAYFMLLTLRRRDANILADAWTAWSLRSIPPGALATGPESLR